MATPHSLPSTPGTPGTPGSPSAMSTSHQSHNKRNSLNQLPLPPTLNAVATQRPPGGTVKSSSPALPTNSTLPITTSIMTSRRAADLPPVVHITAPSSQMRSPTHAGGIQPSASFFRPSKPAQQQQYSRPTSFSSTHAAHDDIYPLSSMSKRQSSSSEGHSVLNIESTDEHNMMKSLKQSRDPLLPIGERPTFMNSRPSVNRERSSASNVTSSRNGTGRMVRNSLEVVFNLRRGISFDSIRKVTSQTDVGGDSDRKFRDEEHGIPTDKRDTLDHSLDTSAPDSAPTPTPHTHTTLSAVPLLDPKTKQPVKNYQLHPSRNRFFMRGRLLTGGDSPWAFIASFSLILGVSGLWLGTTCVWWWHNQSPALAAVGIYLTLVVITSMLRTATTDPGILPRNLDPDPPLPSASSSDGGMRAPMPRDLKVRSDVVRVKYCPTCKTYRPPRSSHCKMCDNCVDGCDHHCQWVNNCVGRRNYATFFILLLSTVLTMILILVTSALHLYWLTQREGVNFKVALRRGTGSGVVFALCIAVFWPVAALLSYHMRLLLLNITTIEQIRNQAHKSLVEGPAPPNPFSHGTWWRNLLAVICRPRSMSWVDPAGIATEDQRQINPGLLENDEWHGSQHPRQS